MERLEGSVFPQAELVLEESQNLLERGGQLAASESSQELSQCLKAPWLPVEGTVLLSSLPCISCSSQAINNINPQQPVISLWLLQQVTPQICSVYLNGSMSQMTLVNGPGQSGVL